MGTKKLLLVSCYWNRAKFWLCVPSIAEVWPPLPWCDHYFLNHVKLCFSFFILAADWKMFPNVYTVWVGDKVEVKCTHGLCNPRVEIYLVATVNPKCSGSIIFLDCKVVKSISIFLHEPFGGSQWGITRHGTKGIPSLIATQRRWFPSVT